MRVQVCFEDDWNAEFESCSALQWVEAAELVQAGTQPWLDVEGALIVAASIGTVWAVAWAGRAIAQAIHSAIR